jgi:hypothetical protein
VALADRWQGADPLPATANLYRRRRKPVNPTSDKKAPERVPFTFSEMVTNERDEMAFYVVLVHGEQVYLKCFAPGETDRVEVTLLLNPLAKIEFTMEWRPYYDGEQAIERDYMLRSKMLAAVLSYVAASYIYDDTQPNADAQAELEYSQMQDAVCEFAAHLGKFIHMPKYPDDDVVGAMERAVFPAPTQDTHTLMRKAYVAARNALKSDA